MQVESMEWVCNYCGGKGNVEYSTNKIEESTLIVCSHCSKPSGYVWCDKCGMGGQITETEFLNSPKSWLCMKCGSEHKLPKDFYQTKIIFAPKYFIDLKKLTLENDMKLQKYIPVWAKNILVFWEKNRKYLLYIFMLSFVFGVIGIIVQDRYLHYDFLFYPIIFWFISFFILVCIDVVLWLIAKWFLLVYKFRKIRE